MTEVANLVQGSQPWLDWRRQHFMASEAAIVMGCAPSYWEVRTADDLRQIKAGAERSEPSALTAKLWRDGHEIEAEVRAGLNARGNRFRPAVFQTGEYGASVDGWDEENGCWLEVKAPRDANSSVYRMAYTPSPLRQTVPDHHWWQLVHQAHCVPGDAYLCLYVVATADRQCPHIEMPIPRSTLLQDWPQLEAAWRAFAEERPNLPPDSDEALALQYREALVEHDSASTRLKRAKTALLAGGPRAISDILEIRESTVRGAETVRQTIKLLK